MELRKIYHWITSIISRREENYSLIIVMTLNKLKRKQEVWKVDISLKIQEQNYTRFYVCRPIYRHWGHNFVQFSSHQDISAYYYMKPLKTKKRNHQISLQKAITIVTTVTGNHGWIKARSQLIPGIIRCYNRWFNEYNRWFNDSIFDYIHIR